MLDYQKYEPDSFWSENVIDNAKEIGALMGMDIDRVYFSGFCSQGDGACFEGSLGYRKGCVAAIKAYAPKDIELHRIAADWASAHRRAFYRVTGSVKQRGHYQHEFCTDFSFDDVDSATEESLIETARDFMRWIYSSLESEYEYAQARELARGWQDLEETAATEKAAARELIRDMRAARNAGASGADSICSVLRGAVRNHFQAMADAQEERKDIESEFWYRDSDNKSWGVAEFAAAHL